MKGCILTVLGVALIVVAVLGQQLVYALRPPAISGRASAEMLASPFAFVMPTGDLELVTRYTPAWVETRDCTSLCATQYPHCALLQRVILTNDPDTLRADFYDSARRLGWSAERGPYPYLGVDHRLQDDAVLAGGFWAILAVVDLDRVGERESQERSLGVPLDPKIWRYVAVLRIEDAPDHLGGHCASKLWDEFVYPRN